MEARSGTIFEPCFGPLWGQFLKNYSLEKFLRNHRNSGLGMKLRATFVKLTHVTSAIRCDDFSQSRCTLGCTECFGGRVPALTLRSQAITIVTAAAVSSLLHGTRRYSTQQWRQHQGFSAKTESYFKTICGTHKHSLLQFYFFY